MAGQLRSWYNHAIMTTIRTFVSIELPANALAALTNLQNRLKTLAPPHTVRWSAPQNIHLTLHFLGDVDTGDVGRISTALETTTADFEPFALSLGNLGCFPNIKRPRVIWVGMQEKNQTLVEMQRALGEQLGKAIGFTPEKRAYSPTARIAPADGRGAATRILRPSGSKAGLRVTRPENSSPARLSNRSSVR